MTVQNLRVFFFLINASGHWHLFNCLFVYFYLGSHDFGHEDLFSHNIGEL